MSAIADYIKICEEAVRAGGATVQDWIGRFQVHEKGPADLVTQADLTSQEVIRRMVLGAFPDHCFLGEEEAGNGGPIRRSPYRWIVDPLDGTTNYVHQVPHYAVSLALEHEGEVLVGAVFDPVLKECFAAVLGRGAWLNGRPIHTSTVPELSQALGATGFPANLPPDNPDLPVFIEAAYRCQSVRRMGSSSLNLCYVAAGRFDVYWSFSTKIWDVAAGALILREAGGVISAPDGGDFVLEDARLLAAANQPLHAKFQDLVRAALSPHERRHTV